MSDLNLRPWQRRRLRRLLERTRDARTYRRTLALLEVDRGRPVSEVARALGVARRSVYNWIAAYLRAGDPSALADAPRPGRPHLWTEQRQAVLRELMATTPDKSGYFAAHWTVPLLGEQLEHLTGWRPCDDTIRDQLGRMGYVWKRPRYVPEPDPESEKKTPNPPGDPGPAAPERAAGRG
jgi:transposase